MKSLHVWNRGRSSGVRGVTGVQEAAVETAKTLETAIWFRHQFVPTLGPCAFVFSWDTRLDKGPDGFFKHCLGWTGVYDLQKQSIVQTISPGNVVTQTELEEQYLNDNYRDLRDRLDPKAKESLQVEEREWLKKREAVKTLQEKVECTVARVNALRARISKLER